MATVQQKCWSKHVILSQVHTKGLTIQAIGFQILWKPFDAFVLLILENLLVAIFWFICVFSNTVITIVSHYPEILWLVTFCTLHRIIICDEHFILNHLINIPSHKHQLKFGLNVQLSVLGQIKKIPGFSSGTMIDAYFRSLLSHCFKI